MQNGYWRGKSLGELSPEEWEALCDGCGKCCLSKLEDEETGDIYWTTVACRQLDPGTCGCRNYPARRSLVPDCVQLTPEGVGALEWLPSTCAYRLVGEGRDLYWWHHLVSGSRETIHEAGFSVRGRITAFDSDMRDDEDYFDHVVELEP